MIPRYSRPEMSKVWSDDNTFDLWLQVEIAASQAWADMGVVPAEDMAKLHHARFDRAIYDRWFNETKHDIVSFTRAVSESLGPESRWIHHGLTSNDVKDTALGMQMAQACDIVDADIVRLIHGDVNPSGPGYKEEVVETSVNKEYPGRIQPLRAGSYVMVPDNPALRLSGSFTLQAWIAATTPQKGVQGIISKWSEDERLGYALVVDDDGSLGLRIGDKGQVARARTGTPLRAALTASRYLQLSWLTSQGTNTTSSAKDSVASLPRMDARKLSASASMRT